ncbi:DUF1467 domain-containing protein [Halostagnicola sp. A-GB9-2]|uniref:DUF1467 domain-containing protein n=1 Tax=Halostagnicola sp. A-GB9-2 TaxID=3048066 RepID=UPI0024C0AB19|nr:DUF1467 domain-containing protein [Halostagnicola sp. A-GB9-2]MDJ1432738.1 DUF1467 domain-containing protein [Halostagnicola sp. A-GB9-2]
MRKPFLRPTSLLLAVSAGIVALGVAINDGFAPSARTVPALFLTGIGLFGVASAVDDRPIDALRLTTGRWWALAFVAFVPYGLATSPSSEQAEAVGNAFSGPVVTIALEALAGTAVLCAVAVTVLYWFARYGIYPGRPSPEERVLDD